MKRIVTSVLLAAMVAPAFAESPEVARVREKARAVVAAGEQCRKVLIDNPRPAQLPAPCADMNAQGRAMNLALDVVLESESLTAEARKVKLADSPDMVRAGKLLESLGSLAR